MKRNKRLAVIAFVALTLVLPFQLPVANAGVADCLSISTPTSSMTSTTLTITATASVTCPASTLGSARSPVVEVQGENFGSRCSGLYNLTPGAYNSLTCTIPISGSLGSSRTGATSTTIKIWFAWDFSTKFITASHQAIPSKVVATVPTPTTTQAPQPQQSPTSNPVVVPQPTQKPATNDQALNEILGLVDSISEQINGLNEELLTKYKLTCKKGTKTTYVTGAKPKCPTGYIQKSKKKIS